MYNNYLRNALVSIVTAMQMLRVTGGIRHDPLTE